MNLLLTFVLLAQACAGAAPTAALPTLNPDRGTSCLKVDLPADTAVVSLGPACAGLRTPSYGYASVRNGGTFCDTWNDLALRIPANFIFRQRLAATASACSTGSFRAPAFLVGPADLSAAQVYACSGTPTPVGYEVARPARPTDGSCGPYTVTLVPSPPETAVQGDLVPATVLADGSILSDSGVALAPTPDLSGDASSSEDPAPASCR